MAYETKVYEFHKGCDFYFMRVGQEANILPTRILLWSFHRGAPMQIHRPCPSAETLILLLSEACRVTHLASRGCAKVQERQRGKSLGEF